MYDAIVIGGGPAGLSAAIWLARYRRKVLLLDEDKGRNRWTEKAHGYLGIDPAAPEAPHGRVWTRPREPGLGS